MRSSWTRGWSAPTACPGSWRCEGRAATTGCALAGRPLAVVVGDGAAMYSIQGLWTAAHLALPITYVIANNRGYRIIKERLVSFRKTDKFTGMDIRSPEIDFVQLAQSCGLT